MTDAQKIEALDEASRQLSVVWRPTMTEETDAAIRRADLLIRDVRAALAQVAPQTGACEQLHDALRAASRELWATYGDGRRLKPLFEQIDKALKGYAPRPAPVEASNG